MIREFCGFIAWARGTGGFRYEDAKLRRIRFHDLRHCHASHLARAGVPVKVAQERLGHLTPTLTLRIYTHTLAGQHEEAAKAVESLLLG